ncbi:hypothetical protein Lal_00042589 [Lupinus albus]|nr:hypothetical protein Lal_00042589 [Lupinus albus]
MVNTQTPVTQTLETQKLKPRGVTSMKSVVRARSNNNKLTGQPCNNKGGNKLVSYIGVLVRQNISIKFKHWSDERLNAVKDIIWNDIICLCILIDEADWIEFVTYRTQDEKLLKISEQNRKRASNPIYPYRASRMGYRGVEEKILEQSETPSPSSATVDLDVFVGGRFFRTADSQVILEKALGLRQYPGRIHGAGFGASKQFMAPSGKRATKADVANFQD